MNSNDARETSLSARTLSGLGWSYLSTFIKALLSLLVLVVLARLLTPVDFGLQGIAWIFIALGARFGQAVVGPAVVQRTRVDRSSYSGRFYALDAYRHCHNGNNLVAGAVYR